VNDNKIEPSIYRYILQHTRKDQVFLLFLTLLTMPVVYASLEIPKIIVNKAISGEGVPVSILGFDVDQIGYLMVLCFTFLALVLLAGGLKYITNVYRGVVGERMLRRIRFDLFARILRFPTQRFKQVSQGEILPMVTAETEPLGGFIGDAFALPAFQGGLLLTYLFFIFNQDFVLGLAAVALYPPQMYVIPKLQKKVNALAKQRVQAVRGLSDKVGESISGISDIHVNDTSHLEKAHVSGKLGLIYLIRFDIYKRKFFIKFINNFLGQLTPFFFYAVGGYYVIKGELTLGALVAVLAAYKDLASPWRELLKFYQITEDIRVKYRQIVEQFQPNNMLSSSLQEDQERDIDLDNSSIKASGIIYSEDEHINSLDGVSFDLNKGIHTGIIGHGGSGRSDLIQLIVRLLHPNNGQIRIFGSNIAEVSESILGRELAYVSPQSYVFNGSVRDNLLYGLKNRQLDGDTSSLTAEQKTLIDNAIKSGNPTEDANGEWINYDVIQLPEGTNFNDYLNSILKATELAEDIYHLGLRSSVDSSEYQTLADNVKEVRYKLRDVIKQKEYKNLVEVLKEDQYNINLSVAENLFFGVPLENDLDYRKLRENEIVVRLLEQTGLTEILFRAGLDTARTLSEIFSDVSDGSPLFERFSFVDAEKLPVLSKLAKLSVDVSRAEVDNQDINLLHDIALKLIVARHRLGIITDSIQEKITEAHLLIKKELGQDNGFIEFFEEDQFANFLSIQDNILFGRVAYGQANAKEKIGKLMDNLIADSGLKEEIINAGLEYNVGVSGARLTNIQRQKLTLARALVKNPKILVLDDVTAIFDKNTGIRIHKSVLEIMNGKTVVWVISDLDLASGFDRIIVMDKGRIVAEDQTEIIMENQDLLKTLE
jgi:ABC-type multidrug transport system fused ATPase/permease subunit